MLNYLSTFPPGRKRGVKNQGGSVRKDVSLESIVKWKEHGKNCLCKWGHSQEIKTFACNDTTHLIMNDHTLIKLWGVPNFLPLGPPLLPGQVK